MNNAILLPLQRQSCTLGYLILRGDQQENKATSYLIFCFIKMSFLA
jgi:hypothetical protein